MAHHDDAAAEAARLQSTLIDFDADLRGNALAELERHGAPLQPDATWDAMAASLARDIGTTIGAVNIIARDGHQTLVGSCPVNFHRDIPWPDGFCPHALLAIGVSRYEVHGARLDPAHQDNSIAREGFDCYMAEKILFNGVAIGTVSVVDERDHQWTQAQRDRLAQAAADALARLTNS